MPHQESKEGWLSVTEVLSIAIDKPFLQFWRGKIGNELASQIQRESQELGTLVHEAIENRFKESAATYHDNVLRMTDNFWNKFVIPHEVKVISLEQTYQDKKLKLQGTMDAHIKTKKGEYLADWKTSNSLDKVSVPLQLAAYCHLSKLDLWKGLAVRIDKKKDKVEIKEYTDLKPYWPVFKHALSLARYIKFGEV